MSVSSSQNSQVPEQSGSITDGTVTLPVSTLRSQTMVSRQLIDQAPPGGGIDRWLAMDTAQAYAARPSQQMHGGTGSGGQLTGILNWPNVLTVDAGSSTAGFWNGIATAQQQIISSLYLPANAAFINPVDWGWVGGTVDMQGRPLLLPHTSTSDALVRVAPECFVAQLRGLSLIVDPSVPSGNVVVARTTELALYEGPLGFLVQKEYGAATMSVLLTALVALTVRAQVAIAAGEPDQAERDAHDALTCGAETKAYLLIPDTRECLAVLTGQNGSHREAARLFGAAHAIRQRMGAVRFKVWDAGYEASVAAVRDALGERDFESAWAEGAALSTEDAIAYAQRGRGERKRPTSGWASLTPAERDVIRLVSEGLGNKDIATRLLVSPRTVQTHLTHVYTKLGLTSRVQLTQEAARRA
jgi:DNA-binding CsgD family transcriptional regulator